MLVLTRKVGESIVVGDQVVIKVIEVSKNKVRIGVDAPKRVSVLRQEIHAKLQEENIRSTKGETDDLVAAASLWEQLRAKE